VTFSNPVAPNMRYWYRVFAIGNTVGDTQAYTGSAGFPTMSIDSVSGILPVVVGIPASAVPANPTGLTATVQTGPRVSLAWTDAASNETGFVSSAAPEQAAPTLPRSLCRDREPPAPLP